MAVTVRVAIAVFAILVHVAAAAAAFGLLFLAAPLCGVVMVLASRALGAPFGSRLSAAATAGGASLLGTLTTFAVADITPLYATAPLLAFIAGALFAPAKQRTSSSCARCRTPRPKEELIRCPRCAGYVCSPCYVPQLSRCAICHEKKNRLLTDDPAWWSAQLGSRVYDGDCRVCMRHGGQQDCDLRVCLHCGWPVCTDCWDDCNATCANCGWRLLDISDRLARTRYTREESGGSFRSR